MVNALEWTVDGVGPIALFRNATGGVVPSQNYYRSDAQSLSTYNTDIFLSNALIAAYAGSSFAGQAWPEDLEMMKWARAVMDYYNRGIPNRADGSKWSARADLVFFAFAVNYFRKFNYRYTYTQADCQMLKEMIPAVDSEIQSVYAKRASGTFGEGEEGESVQILSDLKQHFTTWMAQLSCDQYLTNAENQDVLNTQFQQIKQAQSLTKTNNTTTYVVYGMIAAVLLVTGILLVRK